MADPIQTLKDKISNLEVSQQLKSLLPQDSGWLSRKLLVALVVLIGLIWFGRDDIFKVLEISVKFAGLYIIVQGVVDCVAKFCDAWVRRGLHDNCVTCKGIDAAVAEAPGDKKK